MKMTPLIRFIHLIMQEYDSKCLKKSPESNIPCRSTLEVTYSSG
jgi:hypothetical protein